MNHEGVRTEQELNKLEIQAEPETVAQGIAGAFKKWKAEKTAETEAEAEDKMIADNETPVLETPTDNTETSEASVTEEVLKGEEEYITPRVLSPEESRERMRQREEDAKERAVDLRKLNQEFMEAKPSLKDLPFWEEDFAFSWQILQDYIRRAHGYSMADEARMEDPFFQPTEPGVLHETIEAQSGHFFKERARKLRDAINASDLTGAEKRRQLEKIDAFWENAIRHLRFKNMDRDEIRGYGSEYYEQSRTLRHNATISSLNDLNDLARSYKLTPFTPRNFWTSVGSQKDDPEPIKHRMRYDRDLVEEYYAIAFEREMAEEKKQADDRFSGFLSGSNW